MIENWDDWEKVFQCTGKNEDCDEVAVLPTVVVAWAVESASFIVLGDVADTYFGSTFDDSPTSQMENEGFSLWCRLALVLPLAPTKRFSVFAQSLAAARAAMNLMVRLLAESPTAALSESKSSEIPILLLEGGNHVNSKRPSSHRSGRRKHRKQELAVSASSLLYLQRQQNSCNKLGSQYHVEIRQCFIDPQQCLALMSASKNTCRNHALQVSFRDCEFVDPDQFFWWWDQNQVPLQQSFGTQSNADQIVKLGLHGITWCVRDDITDPHLSMARLLKQMVEYLRSTKTLTKLALADLQCAHPLSPTTKTDLSIIPLLVEKGVAYNTSIRELDLSRSPPHVVGNSYHRDCAVQQQGELYKALNHLSSHPRLDTLILHHTILSPELLQVISKVPRLRVLDLSHLLAHFSCSALERRNDFDNDDSSSSTKSELYPKCLLEDLFRVVNEHPALEWLFLRDVRMCYLLDRARRTMEFLVDLMDLHNSKGYVVDLGPRLGELFPSLADEAAQTSRGRRWEHWKSAGHDARADMALLPYKLASSLPELPRRYNLNQPLLDYHIHTRNYLLLQGPLDLLY